MHVREAEIMANDVSVLCSSECICASGCTSKESLQLCTAYPRAVSALNTIFKFTHFRSGQLEALLPVLHVYCPPLL